ncbi:MAG: zinc ribbon domain-containing protein [bacterium]
MECPKCRHGNPDGAKFCNECGNDLSRLSTPTAKTAAPAPQGERRQATVVFSDLSGYTALNERLDPEEVEAVMRRAGGVPR